MTIRVAAIEVSHWHSLFDAAYLRHLVAMPDVELVAIQDSDVGLVASRAAEVGSPPTFTDYTLGHDAFYHGTSQIFPRHREQNAGDEVQQDDDGHEQTSDSPELLVVHCARHQL